MINFRSKKIFIDRCYAGEHASARTIALRTPARSHSRELPKRGKLCSSYRGNSLIDVIDWRHLPQTISVKMDLRNYSNQSVLGLDEVVQTRCITSVERESSVGASNRPLLCALCISLLRSTPWTVTLYWHVGYPSNWSITWKPGTLPFGSVSVYKRRECWLQKVYLMCYVANVVYLALRCARPWRARVTSVRPACLSYHYRALTNEKTRACLYTSQACMFARVKLTSASFLYYNTHTYPPL